MHLVGFIIRN